MKFIQTQNKYSILLVKLNQNYLDCMLLSCRTSFRVNLHSIVCLNAKELLAQSRCFIWSVSDSNKIRTENHLVRKRTLSHLAELAKLLSVCLRTKRLWVRISLLSQNYLGNNEIWSNNKIRRLHGWFSTSYIWDQRARKCVFQSNCLKYHFTKNKVFRLGFLQ